mmetsp:Transcript_39927/g.89500  ORF Transcript_39927/g.89500 Transcript_39927/m.89500 type:complete len:266 (-) Transcript_39927:274-1071(-)
MMFTLISVLWSLSGVEASSECSHFCNGDQSRRSQCCFVLIHRQPAAESTMAPRISIARFTESCRRPRTRITERTFRSFFALTGTIAAAAAQKAFMSMSVRLPLVAMTPVKKPFAVLITSSMVASSAESVLDLRWADMATRTAGRAKNESRTLPMVSRPPRRKRSCSIALLALEMVSRPTWVPCGSDSSSAAAAAILPRPSRRATFTAPASASAPSDSRFGTREEEEEEEEGREDEDDEEEGEDDEGGAASPASPSPLPSSMSSTS